MTRLVLTLGLGMIASGLPAASVSAPVAKVERIGSETERISAEVGPKVVQVATQMLKVAGAGDDEPTGVLVAERGRGSGFFVTSDGYIVTNAHVVVNAIRVRVLTALGGAAREYPATVIGMDADNDLAVLKIDVANAPHFDLGAGGEAHQGQLVLAYGSPMGLAQSVSLGLVSAADRQLTPDDPRAYIQTDASMNPGNSGGPLVDLEGRLLGINTMILSQSGGSEGLGFAVPLEMIRRSYTGIKETGTLARPRMGIQPKALTPELIAGLGLKTRSGVLVEDVSPYGPGVEAGLEPGDVMVAIGEEKIATVRDLFHAEYALTPGVAVPLTVMRGAEMRLLRITPGTPTQVQPMVPPSSISEKENLVQRLGMYGATLTQAMAGSMGGVRGGPGVLVVALTGTGVSGQNPLAPGDVVHRVNGTRVDSVDGLRAAVEQAGEGGPLVVQIERGGVLQYVLPGALPLAEAKLKKAAMTDRPARELAGRLMY